MYMHLLGCVWGNKQYVAFKYQFPFVNLSMLYVYICMVNQMF